MRIAKDALAQQVKMLAQLALGIESTPGIIKIDLSQIVQPCVLSCSQVIQSGRTLKCRVRLPEGLLRLTHFP